MSNGQPLKMLSVTRTLLIYSTSREDMSVGTSIDFMSESCSRYAFVEVLIRPCWKTGVDDDFTFCSRQTPSQKEVHLL